MNRKNTSESAIDIPSTAYVIGIAGGTASGKTTFTMKLLEGLGQNAVHFSFDMFYRGITDGINPDFYDFDQPSSLDFDLAFECLKKLKNKQAAEIPIYDFVTHSRREEKTIAEPANLVIIEGILALHDPRIRDLMDLKIFVNVEPDEALCRRLLRDIGERGRSYTEVLSRYNRFVRIDYKQFIKPTIKYADLIVPSKSAAEKGSRKSDTDIALNVILKKVKDKLKVYENGREHTKNTNAIFKTLIATTKKLTEQGSNRLYLDYRDHNSEYLFMQELCSRDTDFNFDFEHLRMLMKIWWERLMRKAERIISEDLKKPYAELECDMKFSKAENIFAESESPINAHLILEPLFYKNFVRDNFDYYKENKGSLGHINHPKYIICVFTSEEMALEWLELLPTFKIIPLFVVDWNSQLIKYLQDKYDARGKTLHEDFKGISRTIKEKELKTRKGKK